MHPCLSPVITYVPWAEVSKPKAGDWQPQWKANLRSRRPVAEGSGTKVRVTVDKRPPGLKSSNFVTGCRATGCVVTGPRWSP